MWRVFRILIYIKYLCQKSPERNNWMAQQIQWQRELSVVRAEAHNRCWKCMFVIMSISKHFLFIEIIKRSRTSVRYYYHHPMRAHIERTNNNTEKPERIDTGRALSVNTLDVMRECDVRIKHKYLMAYWVIICDFASWALVFAVHRVRVWYRSSPAINIELCFVDLGPIGKWCVHGTASNINCETSTGQSKQWNRTNANMVSICHIKYRNKRFVAIKIATQCTHTHNS